MVAQQKNNGWFFNKNIIDEINSIPEEKVGGDINLKSAPTLKMVSDNTVGDLSNFSTTEPLPEEVKELKRLIFEKEQTLQKYKRNGRKTRPFNQRK